MKQFKTKQTQTGGFTLIEILVVIGIIAVLAAIVLIAINPARQFAQARDTQRTSNVNAILNSIGQYIADHQGKIPSAITTAETDIDDTLCDELVPTYMPAIPTDPASTFRGSDVACSDLSPSDPTGYTVEELTGSSTGRIVVCTDSANTEDSIPRTDQICVTR